MGGFAPEPSPPPPLTASEANDDDEDASSSNTDEMSTWHSYPLSLVTKRGSSFGYKSTHT